jgi:hypothetical protein
MAKTQNKRTGFGAAGLGPCIAAILLMGCLADGTESVTCTGDDCESGGSEAGNFAGTHDAPAEPPKGYDETLTPAGVDYLLRGIQSLDRSQQLTKAEWTKMGLSKGSLAYRQALGDRLPSNVVTTLKGNAQATNESAPGIAAASNGVPKVVFERVRRQLRAQNGQEPTEQAVLKHIEQENARVAELNASLAEQRDRTRQLYASGDTAGVEALRAETLKQHYPIHEPPPASVSEEEQQRLLNHYFITRINQLAAEKAQR